MNERQLEQLDQALAELGLDPDSLDPGVLAALRKARVRDQAVDALADAFDRAASPTTRDILNPENPDHA
jgi:HEAT repeat protein